MNNRRHTGKYLFLGIFFLTMLVCVYGGVLDSKVDLDGVTAQTEAAGVTLAGLMDGSAQTEINTWFENNFPGRKALTKVRNQALYSLLNTSPNSNVVIGKDKYLFEPDYIHAELMANVPYDENYYTELGRKLGDLQELLDRYDKELYVFVTPSKARFCADKIPGRYMILDRREEYGWNEYEKLLGIMEEKGILYYDAVRYAQETQDAGLFDSPVFYKTGTHWSESYAKSAAAEFMNLIRENSRFDLGSAYVKEETSPEPVFPATDLYDSLNLLAEAEDSWYRADTFIKEEGKDHPNVFARGGSFMGQSISQLIRLGIFGKDMYYENYYYYTDNFTNYVCLSGFGAYDEVDIDRYMGQSDILLLEVNEAAINRMSFGFIDYLLEHPEVLDREYAESNSESGGN